MHLINVSLTSPSSEDSGERVSFSGNTSLTPMQVKHGIAVCGLEPSWP